MVTWLSPVILSYPEPDKGDSGDWYVSPSVGSAEVQGESIIEMMDLGAWAE